MQRTPSAFSCIVDLTPDPAEDTLLLRASTYAASDAAYIPPGIDPSVARILQSEHVLRPTELAWLLALPTPLRLAQPHDAISRRMREIARLPASVSTIYVHAFRC